ncbi:hypothetical protein Misp01_23150 [Microtetraspora sp. NBRC 13810]|uniref:STAS domain-containing protein n=1 Tax=Microtetraspora sp. NBRC 13810 TaxID=3030990 RepID=UPI0024A06921|nr:STAS domain-containing protein [Microtetraspora sp. NBRC 13810]GLW07185.1 hypothetical protein Misp01_23150 [Microtetraspora sp. NBRC 13810]
MTAAVQVTPSTETEREDVCVLALAGNLDYTNAEQLRAELAGRLRPEHRHLVLDFTELSFLDSTGVRIVLAVRNDVLRRGGVIALVALNARIARVFQITGLIRAFAVYPTREEALAALPGAAG